MGVRKRYDWESLKRVFITDENVTLESLSRNTTGLDTSPSIQALREHSAKENWAEQRKAYHRNINAAAAKTAEQITARTEELIDAAEAVARHIKLAKILQSVGYQRLKSLDPESLSPKDAIAMVQLGTDLERKALALYEPPKQENLQVDISFENLTTGELEMVKNAILKTMPSVNN
jgi:hypothetical protein